MMSVNTRNYGKILLKSGTVFILFILFSKRGSSSFNIKYVSAKVEFGFCSVKMAKFF